jgi:acyl-CoA synthetase (AMP-forming)/AMP-acid ligase II/NADP-dependent 3-hydroxy acid dehydrogenase YdfG/acyl carrier protein
MSDFHADVSKVEAAILAHSSIRDCAVLVRQTEAGFVLVAYVVPTAPFSSAPLHAYLGTVLPPSQHPSAYVPLSTLPYNPAGQLDREALLQLEVIEPDLVQRWHTCLRSQPGVENVEVVIQTQPEPHPPLHVSDLIPHWSGAIAESVNSDPALDSPLANQPASGSQRLAISHGEPLTQDSNAPVTLADALQRAARQQAAKGMVYLQPNASESVQSYADLFADAQRILAGLRACGLQPQAAVIFQFDRPQPFLTAFWACQLGGFVPVPLSLAIGQDNNAIQSKLKNAWNLLGHPIVLTETSQATAVQALSKLPGLAALEVATVENLLTFEPDFNWHRSQPEDIALFLLTSGSTGMPKLVTHSHFSLLQQVAATVQMNQFSPDDISLNWLPLDHVGGIVFFHLRDVYLGCQQIHAPMQTILQQPLQWLTWIDRYSVTLTWAPNFAYELVNSHLEKGHQGMWDLSCLRFIFNGGEAIVAQQSRRFMQGLAPYGLPATAMHPVWGMAETSSGSIFSHSFSLDSTTDRDSFVEIGAPMPGFSIRIVDEGGDIVREETVGQLQVRGACVTSGYYQNSAANQEAFTADRWFNTGDLGILRDGKLTITGRQKDVIVINGLNHYSHEIEAVVDAIAEVEASYTAAIGVRAADSTTDQLAIAFSPVCQDPANLALLLTTIRQQVVQSLGINPIYLLPLEKTAIPKTAIGKIQRSQLKQSFEAGAFEDRLKQIDLQLGTRNTLPNWFYRRVWQRKDYAAIVPESRPDKALIFVDRLGLGEAVCKALDCEASDCDNQTWIAVEAGTDFLQLGPNRYCLAPENPHQYQQLIASVIGDRIPITQILHLWTYDDAVQEISSVAALEQAQTQGIDSLLFLTQALVQVQGSRQRVQLQIGGSHTQSVMSEDAIAYEKSPLLGLLKTIPHELPWIKVRHIDLAIASQDEMVHALLQELRILSDDREVAYRHGQRFVTGLERVDLAQTPSVPLPFKPGGLYLITGGLGGIGVVIAKELLQRHQAKLLLIGTTPLPERNTWPSHLLNKDSAIAERIRTFQMLERLEGDVIYEAVDVCDADRLQQAVDRAQLHWGIELDGILHLAGGYHEAMLRDLSQPDLMASLRPKVTGSWVLHQLLKHRPQALFIAFASINGYFGGTTVGAYAAASRFQEAFTAYQNRRSSLQSYCFFWSMWEDIGISRGYPMVELTRARGFQTITPHQGLLSLQAGLCHRQHQLLIGLEGTNPYLRSLVQGRSQPLQTLSAYVIAPSASIASWSELEIRDRFGTRSTCNFIPVSALPMAADPDTASIDWDGRLSRAAISPLPHRTQTQIEHQIAEIWQEVLDLPKVGVQENFFDLGGHSILMAQVQSKLADQFESVPSMVDLFRYPTIQELASYISQATNPQAESQAQPVDLTEIRATRISTQQQQRQLRQRHRSSDRLNS